MTSPLTTEEDARGLDLDELEQIAQAATQGAWTAYETMQADNFVHSGGGPLTGTVIAGPTYERANTAYIAAFDPPTVLALIAAARRSVVSTPHTLADEDREAEGWRESEEYADDADPSKRMETMDDFMTGWRTSDRTRWAVSAPPTITDEALLAAFEEHYLVDDADLFYDRSKLLDGLRAVAALGGEA